MRRTATRSAGLALAAALTLITASCSTTSPERGAREPAYSLVTIDHLRFPVSDDWVAETPESSMRKAEYILPHEEAGDGSLIVYYFGANGAGPVDANLDRWRGQFEQPDGGEAIAVIGRRTRHGLQVHEMEVAGRFIAETTPGSGERLDEPQHRMLAAIIETPDGPYYIKAVGPEAAIAHHEMAIRSFMGDFTYEATGAGVAGAAHP